MRNEFENVSRKLVLISDCHGTLVSLSRNLDPKDLIDGKIPGSNEPLLEDLIQAKEAGHTVIITSSSAGLETVTPLLLKKYDRLPDLFDIQAGSEVYRVVVKKKLPHVLSELSIETVDCIFDDERPETYLPNTKILKHVDPIDFLRKSSSETSRQAFRNMMQFAP